LMCGNVFLILSNILEKPTYINALTSLSSNITSMTGRWRTTIHTLSLTFDFYYEISDSFSGFLLHVKSAIVENTCEVSVLNLTLQWESFEMYLNLVFLYSGRYIMVSLDNLKYEFGPFVVDTSLISWW
jgi:hypothetical protein